MEPALVHITEDVTGATRNPAGRLHNKMTIFVEGTLVWPTDVGYPPGLVSTESMTREEDIEKKTAPLGDTGNIR